MVFLELRMNRITYKSGHVKNFITLSGLSSIDTFPISIHFHTSFCKLCVTNKIRKVNPDNPFLSQNF